jgi:pSer/pThr/pTyr-binding forkhead associated (FHA) protein
MVDPRLNSVHLEFPRREQFRQARDVLLNARGMQTVLAEKKDIEADHPNTIIQNERGKAPAGVQFWLKDDSFIYPLKIGLNTVGRSPDNDVVVQDGFVSRRHCAILVHASKGAELYDTASKNGTFLNGHKIAGPTRLRTGDEIRMCDRNLIFVMRDEDVPPSPAHTITVQE